MAKSTKTAATPVEPPVEASEKPKLGARLTAWALRRKPVRAYLLFSSKNSGQLADAVTYRMLFAVFAALVLAFSIVGLVFQGDPSLWQKLMQSVERAIPGLGDAVLFDEVNPPTGWSLPTVIAILGLIGSALGAVSAMGFALRELDGTIDRKRNPVWEILRKLVIALGVAVLFALSAVMSYAGAEGIGWLTRSLGIPNADFAQNLAVEILTVVLVFLLDVALIAMLFAVLSGLRAHKKQFWPGVIIGALGLVILQQASSLFVGNLVGRYPVAGSVLSVIALLLWLNLSAQVILFASAYIITGVQDDEMTGPYPTTMAEYKELQARRNADVADARLAEAKAAVSEGASSASPQGTSA